MSAPTTIKNSKPILTTKRVLYAGMVLGSAIEVGFIVAIYRYFSLFGMMFTAGTLNLALGISLLTFVWVGGFLPFAQKVAVQRNVHWLLWTEHPLIECLITGLLSLAWVGVAVAICLVWFPVLRCSELGPLADAGEDMICRLVAGALINGLIIAAFALALSVILLLMYRSLRRMTIRGSAYSEMA